MNPLLVLAVALAGALGSVLRYLTDNTLPERYKQTFPWGTVIINLAGSFVLGLIVGTASAWLPAPWITIASVGLLGCNGGPPVPRDPRPS